MTKEGKKEIVKWAGGPGWMDAKGNEPPVTYAVIEYGKCGRFEPLDYDEDRDALAARNGLN